MAFPTSTGGNAVVMTINDCSGKWRGRDDVGNTTTGRMPSNDMDQMGGFTPLDDRDVNGAASIAVEKDASTYRLHAAFIDSSGRLNYDRYESGSGWLGNVLVDDGLGAASAGTPFLHPSITEMGGARPDLFIVYVSTGGNSISQAKGT